MAEPFPIETDLPKPVVQTFEQQVRSIDKAFRELTLRDDDAYEQAGRLRVFVNGVIQTIKDTCAPVKKATNDAHRAACKQERELLEAPTKLRGEIDRAMVEYHDRREAELREREKQLAQESRAEQDDALLAEAEELASEGRQAEADALLEQAGAPAATQKLEGPSFQGGSIRKKYVGEVVSLQDFVASAVKHPEILAFLKIDQGRLDRHLTNLDGHLPQGWKGVVVNEKKHVASKRGA